MLFNTNNVYVVTMTKMFVCENVINAQNAIDEMNVNDCEYNVHLCDISLTQILTSIQYNLCATFVHQMYSINKMTFEIVIAALREYVKKIDVVINENELQTLYIHCEHEHECMNDDVTNNIATCVIDVDAHNEIAHIDMLDVINELHVTLKSILHNDNDNNHDASIDIVNSCIESISLCEYRSDYIDELIQLHMCHEQRIMTCYDMLSLINKFMNH